MPVLVLFEQAIVALHTTADNKHMVANLLFIILLISQNIYLDYTRYYYKFLWEYIIKNEAGVKPI
jgi:hypothetical protein